MKTIKTFCLIIGGGAGGLSSGINFLKNFKSENKTEKCIIISPNISNSAISPWNIMECTETEVENKIKKAGDNLSDPEVLAVFSQNHKNSFAILEKLGIKLVKSNIGKVPKIRGVEIIKKFRKRFNELGGKIINGTVTNFLIDMNKEIKGVIGEKNNEKIKIISDQLIITAGGLTNLYKYATGYSSKSIPNILSLCLEAGIKIENLEFNMFHPFLIIDKRLPKTLISGEILQKANFVDGKRKEFLTKKIKDALRNNQHHYVFPEMTREFYTQSSKSRIYMDLSDISEQYFEKYKKENEFGWIFSGKKLEDVRKVEIHPAFHYSIGGIKINSKAETNKKNVYAAGEITSGLHGSNRIGGFAVSEALVFGQIAGKEAAKKAKIPEEKETIKTGNSHITEELKELVWNNLGPIKNYGKLIKLKEKLENKSNLFSEEKLVLEMIKSSLKRGNLGTNYVINRNV